MQGRYQTVPQGLQPADRGSKAANWFCGWTHTGLPPTSMLPPIQPQTYLQSNKRPTSNPTRDLPPIQQETYLQSNKRPTSNQLPRHCKGNNTSTQIQHKQDKIQTSKSRSNKKHIQTQAKTYPTKKSRCLRNLTWRGRGKDLLPLEQRAVDRRTGEHIQPWQRAATAASKSVQLDRRNERGRAKTGGAAWSWSACQLDAGGCRWSERGSGEDRRSGVELERLPAGCRWSERGRGEDRRSGVKLERLPGGWGWMQVDAGGASAAGAKTGGAAWSWSACQDDGAGCRWMQVERARQGRRSAERRGAGALLQMER
jgi:hypothetical protein